jgi:uncharacterized protein
MSTFVGRDFELAKLKELTRLDAPSLVVIKGRRRVGKSRLATEFAARLSGYRSILLTGMAPDDKVTAGDGREIAQQTYANYEVARARPAGRLDAAHPSRSSSG